MANTGVRSKRPISPHLQIYKPIPTMVMSILHRITGSALYFGVLILVWWLVAAASGAASYDFANAILSSWFGKLLMFGFTWALMFHMLGGIRHLVWDTGRLLEKHVSTMLAWATLIGSVVLTVLIWMIAIAAS